MADGTKIEWTDATWNPVTGCSVVSPGCTNCYAMRWAGTRLQHHPSRKGLTTASSSAKRDRPTGDGTASSSPKGDRPTKHVWNGQVRFTAEWLTQPLRWTRPRRIFVAAHGDLFHDGVTDDQLDQIFAVMALCPRHTFQILTKRPERMRAYLAATGRGVVIQDHINDRIAEKVDPLNRRSDDARATALDPMNDFDGYHPLPNVWLGVSVEDQTRADERIPILLATPAAVRWISAEPLLGPVDLDTLCDGNSFWSATQGLRYHDVPDDMPPYSEPKPRLDWVVAGGESGPGARPMHPDWARTLRDQCADAGVAFLFKQWGNWAPVCALDDDQTDRLYHPNPAHQPEAARRCRVARHTLQRDGTRHDPAEPGAWQQGTGPMLMLEAGKKAAGRHLDGVIHDAWPAVRS